MSIPRPPQTGNVRLDEFLNWVWVILKNPAFTDLISDGKMLIGKTNGEFNLTTLTAGAGITITNGDGTVTISSP